MNNITNNQIAQQNKWSTQQKIIKYDICAISHPQMQNAIAAVISEAVTVSKNARSAISTLHRR